MSKAYYSMSKDELENELKVVQKKYDEYKAIG